MLSFSVYTVELPCVPLNLFVKIGEMVKLLTSGAFVEERVSSNSLIFLVFVYPLMGSRLFGFSDFSESAW